MAEAAYQDFGLHLVRACLTRLGKSHGFEPHIFHEAASQQVQFGAVAQKEATIQWQGVCCLFSPGDWLAMGSAQQFTAATLISELAEFDVQETWHASDGRADVLLLKKK